MIAQELIAGPESRVESYHAYVDASGQVVAEFTGAKIRAHPPAHGFSTAVRTTRADDLVHAGRELVEALHFRGVLKADYKRDARGALHLLEVNPRFSLWHHLGAAAGVNLPALVYADLTDTPRPTIPRPRTDATWCQLGGDRRAAAAQGLPLFAWARWAARTSARAEGRWTDPMPVLRGIIAPKLSGRRPAT